jgi:(1->4)-alpha-D-glucan 1-alpha-D-glucosylmutase
VLASGSAREHIVAYTRGDEVLVAVSRWTARLNESGRGETGWGDTVLPLPDGQWTDVLTDRQRKGAVSAAELFDDLPVALLERADERLDA